MEKLILFIHGLGGTKESFGNFKQFINEDEELKEYTKNNNLLFKTMDLSFK